eukprot:2880427-Prymnesium_polylepis.1
MSSSAALCNDSSLMSEICTSSSVAMGVFETVVPRIRASWSSLFSPLSPSSVFVPVPAACAVRLPHARQRRSSWRNST